jgi:hypothetical protein
MFNKSGIRTAIALVSLLSLGACASFTGYPDDPVPGSSDLPALKDYFDPQRIVEYDLLTDAQQRRQMRDAVVWGRVSAYDAKFRQFRKKLASEANGTNVGSDVATLILSGVGATSGTAATKSALAAATNVVTGTKGSLSKNLFYEKTLPALFTQMDAGRAKILARITKGLSAPDAEYPLQLALVDLSAYADAGSIPGAIAGVTEQAAVEKAAAEVDVSAFRAGNYVETDSTKRIMAWLYPPDGNDVDANGNPKEMDQENYRKLYVWIANYKADPRIAAIPFDDFLNKDKPEIEKARQQAIKEIRIP